MIFQDYDEDDLDAQYFISVEQTLILESSNIFGAVFYWIAAHYIFNVQYHPKVSSVLLFLQEKVLSLPSKSMRRTPTFMTHVSGISRAKDLEESTTEENMDCNC